MSPLPFACSLLLVYTGSLPFSGSFGFLAVSLGGFWRVNALVGSPEPFSTAVSRRASSVPIPHHASPGLSSVSSLGRFSGAISATILPLRFPGVILRYRFPSRFFGADSPSCVPGAIFRLVSGQILRCLFRGYSSAVLLQDSAPSRVRPSRDQDQ